MLYFRQRHRTRLLYDQEGERRPYEGSDAARCAGWYIKLINCTSISNRNMVNALAAVKPDIKSESVKKLFLE